ncbi:MAG TPA: TPM domain-containing protein, partial [Bacteroidales bacterium]|nr:TPM domain-containing protein [Bacteroidales bacterium]
MLLLWLTLFSAASQVPARPDPPRLVNDLAGLLSPEQADAMERELVAFNDSTSNQIAVVILTDLMGYDKADLAYRIGESWGVGQGKFDNGLVILLRPKQGSSRGEIFIAVGYGLEGAIPDARVNRMIDQVMIPRFREDDYYGGLMNGIRALEALASGEYSEQGFGQEKKEEGYGALVFIILLIVLFIFISRNNRRKMHSLGGSIPWWMLLPRGGSGGSFGGFGGG